MKRKVLCVFSLIFYLLTAFTLLSRKIEEEMLTVAEVRVVDTRKYISTSVDMPLRVLFTDEGGDHLYEVVDGTGWESGLRFQEVHQGLWTVSENMVKLPADKDRRLVQSATRQPTPGERVEILEDPERIGDRYLAVYALSCPEAPDLPSYAETAAQSGNALLLNMTNVLAPFMEHRAKGMSAAMSMADRIFSLTEVAQFLENLPLAALLIWALLAPLAIWLYSCLLARDPYENKHLLLLNTGTVIGLLFAANAVMEKIDLPASLLPPVNILDAGYYQVEFTQIFTALRGLGDAAQDIMAIAEAIPKQICLTAAAGLGLTSAFLLAEILVHQLRNRPVQPNNALHEEGTEKRSKS